MDHRFRDAKVAGRDALVEAPDALGGVYSLHALTHGHFGFGVIVQLKSRLDEPDRIGEGGRHEAGARCTHDVHQRRVGRNDTNRVQCILGLRVSTEVERPRRCHADDVRAEAFEQGAGTFGLNDVLQALPDRDRLDRRRETTLGNRKDRWAPTTENGTGTYSLSAGMVVVVVRIGGRRRGPQLMVVIVGGDQFPPFFG